MAAVAVAAVAEAAVAEAAVAEAAVAEAAVAEAAVAPDDVPLPTPRTTRQMSTAEPLRLHPPCEQSPSNEMSRSCVFLS